MLFVLAGIAFIAMHFLGVGAPARWNWELFGDLWKFLAPFLLALAWWQWKDATGRSGKEEMDRDEERKAQRHQRTAEALGLGHRRRDTSPKDR